VLALVISTWCLARQVHWTRQTVKLEQRLDWAAMLG